MKLTGLPYTVYINRKLGSMIANACPKSITPNSLTFISFIVFLIASYLLITSNNIVTSSLATILFLFQYALDSADGVLARLRNQSSKVGEWLDHSLDGLRIVILHIAVLVMLFVNNGMIGLIEILAVGISIISMSGNYIANQLKVFIIGTRSGELLNDFKSYKRILLKSLLIPADFGIYYMLFFFIHSSYFLEIYLLWGLYFFAIFLANMVTTYRQGIKD